MVAEEPQDDGKGFFYAADDEEPEVIDDTEEIERRLQAQRELERRTFGKPAFEYSNGLRLPVIQDLMAEARALDTDHRVDECIITQMQSSMEDALFVPAEDPEVEQ